MALTADRDGSPAHVIVLGNEKGGSGKTTTAMHIVVALSKLGARVGTIDLDSRQRSLTRYVENRAIWCSENRVKLQIPDHAVIERAEGPDAVRIEADRFKMIFERHSKSCDFVVIDSPGTDTPLSRLGHKAADTLVTPMNDSFVDFDLLARIDPDTYDVKSPSLYAEMVWECRQKRAGEGGRPIDWVVMRNRLSSLDARNKRRVEHALKTLSGQIGFRIAAGFGERVIFRELFPNGLTLLDLRDETAGRSLSMSHVAARAEVRSLMDDLRLPALSAAGPGEAAHAAAMAG